MACQPRGRSWLGLLPLVLMQIAAGRTKPADARVSSDLGRDANTAAAASSCGLWSLGGSGWNDDLAAASGALAAALRGELLAADADTGARMRQGLLVAASRSSSSPLEAAAA